MMNDSSPTIITWWHRSAPNSLSFTLGVELFHLLLPSWFCNLLSCLSSSSLHSRIGGASVCFHLLKGMKRRAEEEGFGVRSIYVLREGVETAETATAASETGAAEIAEGGVSTVGS
ncbi:hypothetical protein RJT34_12147 [Clitoria ternatea]|uniref:Uncharacterized protein n=1 Tax=Clitoria ternatea TaxID=43366 RepID=A0AAN9JN72_CLITE